MPQALSISPARPPTARPPSPPPETRPPETRPPEVETPEVETPEAETPEAETPETAEADTAGCVPARDHRRIVVGERIRFARDLHDLLGPRLSAITLQCELAHRLMETRPETARHQLAEALTGMRQILDEVRQVAHGYHCLSLDTEVESTRALLESAGIRTDVHLDREALPAPLQTVLATTVREAAANVLKHSRARNCRLSVEVRPGGVQLTLTNDGVRAPAASARPGLGLCSLTERVAAVGGHLTHGPLSPDRYTLRARFPLAATTQGRAREGGSAA